MYRCKCGFETAGRSIMATHVRRCSTAKRHAACSTSSGATDSDGTMTTGFVDSFMNDCLTTSDVNDPSPSDYSGGGGEFGGGGASGDW